MAAHNKLAKKLYSFYRAGLGHEGALGRPIMWLHSQRYYLKFLSLEQGWRNFLRTRAQEACNFRRNSFTCGNLSIVAPYFWLSQWRLGAPYSLVARGAARMAGPVVRPCPFSESKTLLSCKTSLSQRCWETLNILGSFSVDWQIFTDVSEDRLALSQGSSSPRNVTAWLWRWNN
jgi:hypothetical protein